MILQTGALMRLHCFSHTTYSLTTCTSCFIVFWSACCRNFEFLRRHIRRHGLAKSCFFFSQVSDKSRLRRTTKELQLTRVEEHEMHRKLHLACPTSLRSLHVGFWSNPAFSLHPCFLNTLKASQGSFLTSRVETLNMLLIQHWEVVFKFVQGECT